MKYKEFHGRLYKRMERQELSLIEKCEKPSVRASVTDLKPIKGRILPTIDNTENTHAICVREEFRL